MGRMPVLDMAAEGGTFLLNSPYPAAQVLRRLPAEVVATMRAKQLKVFVIDADGLARSLGLGNRINVIMQTCFFALTDLLPLEQAQDAIKDAIAKTYGKKGGK
ncbi:2-oxoacid:acceptor oxidoreductase family protein, partial [Arthrospira platensis SPKY1]|nr:2-oxoacid:acceptor oxidoreductase family protein [Arthrospira platensis SPKY1]